MVAVLMLWILCGIAGVGLIAMTIVYRTRAKRRVAIGRRNADRLLAESCYCCHEPVDPSVDLFLDNEWMHRRCFQQLGDESK